MKVNRLNILATVLTIAFILGFFIIDEAVLFETYIGVLFILLLLLAYLLSSYAMMSFDHQIVSKGNKHKEKILGLNIYILSFFTLVMMLYIADWYYAVNILVLILIFASLFLLTVYFALAYMFDYVILQDDAFIASSFLSLKPETIYYKEIKLIRFGGLLNTLQIETDKSKVHVDVSLVNIDAFLNDISSQTEPNVHAEAFEKLRDHFKRFGLKRNLSYLDYFNHKT